MGSLEREEPYGEVFWGTEGWEKSPWEESLWTSTELIDRAWRWLIAIKIIATMTNSSGNNVVAPLIAINELNGIAILSATANTPIIAIITKLPSNQYTSAPYLMSWTLKYDQFCLSVASQKRAGIYSFTLAIKTVIRACTHVENSDKNEINGNKTRKIARIISGYCPAI